MELFQYWNAIRAERDLPRRDEIDPGQIRSLLPNLFILQRQADGDIRFRLAGTHVCALFGQELRDQKFAALWLDGEADKTARIAEQVMAQHAPVLLSAWGATGTAEPLDTELLLAPLASRDGTGDRVLGALSPLSRPAWLHMTPIAHLLTRGLRFLDPARNALPERPEIVSNVTEASPDGHGGMMVRKVRHLRVLEGGR